MGDESNKDISKPRDTESHSGETDSHQEHRNKPSPVAINITQSVDNSSPPEEKAPKPYRDWHDKWILVLLFFGFLAAAAAAGFTLWEGYTADKALELAKKTSTAQIRAYVFVRAFPRVNSRKNPHTGLPIRNSGQTPATELSLRAQIIIGDERAAPSPTETVFESAPPLKIDTILDPSTNISRFPLIPLERSLTDDELAAVEKGELRFFVYGLLSYRDVLKDPHRSYFCFDYRGWGPSPDTGMGTTSQHFCKTPDSY